MTDRSEHLFTVHSTYTGDGCAHCRRNPEAHPNRHMWMINGEQREVFPESFCVGESR